MPMFNPYYPGFMPQMNPLAPYQERLNQMQIQSQQNTMQSMGLNGEVVDSLDVVKAKNVDMSGNVTFYPKSDLSEIYTKRLMPNGTSQIDIYIKKEPVDMAQPVQTSQGVSIDTLNVMLGQLKTDLSTEINGLKEMVGVAINTSSPKTTRGGKTDA